MKTDKIKKLINALTPIEERSDVFGALDKELANVADKLKEAVKAKSMEQVDNEFRKLKSAFKSIINAFDELKNDLAQREADLLEKINAKNEQIVKILDTTVENEKSDIKNSHNDLLKEQNELKEKFGKIARISNHLMEAYKTEIGNVETRTNDLIEEFQKNFEKGNEDMCAEMEELKKEAIVSKESIDKLKKELNQRLAQHGGGQANRNITVNSSSSTLGKYTDIDFGTGSAIGWNVAVDDVNKRIRIFPSLLAGGASGGGVWGSITGTLSDQTDLQNALKASFGIVLDGSGAPIQTGAYGSLVIPFAGTITGWQIFETSDTPISTSTVIDTWSDVYSASPPTVADTIWGGSKPTLSATTKNEATGLSIAVTANTILRFNVDSNNNAQKISLVIFITKT